MPKTEQNSLEEEEEDEESDDSEEGKQMFAILIDVSNRYTTVHKIFCSLHPNERLALLLYFSEDSS